MSDKIEKTASDYEEIHKLTKGDRTYKEAFTVGALWMQEKNKAEIERLKVVKRRIYFARYFMIKRILKDLASDLFCGLFFILCIFVPAGILIFGAILFPRIFTTLILIFALMIIGNFVRM